MTPPRGSSGLLLPVCLALVATAMMARGTLDVGLVGHDTYPIVATSRVETTGDIGRVLGRELMDGRYTADFYRPLFGLTVAFDHALWGLDPLGYQITSLLLFGAGGLVVFVLAKSLLGEGATIGPLAALIFFVLHPTHIEVVPVPARRPDALCWLFLGLALWLQSRRGSRDRRGTTVFLFVAAFLAMMSKETALLLPFLASLVAWLVPDPGGRRRTLSEAARSTIPVWIALAAALAVRFAVLGGVGGHGAAVRGPSLDRIPSAMLAVWALLVGPQPVREAEVVGSPWVALWSVVFVASIAGCAVSWLRRRGLSVSRPLPAPPARALALAFSWLVLLAATYALAGGIQAWYLLIPVATFALMLGAGVEVAATMPRLDGAAPRASATALAISLAALLAWHAAYSPLFRRYDAWDRATRVSEEFFAELRSGVESAPPGATVRCPPIPFWVPVEPGEASVRGASVLAPYSVQAWLEMSFPERDFRVVESEPRSVASSEVVVVADRILDGYASAADRPGR